MARALDPVVAEALKKYGFGKEAVWDCHGVWVVYHRALEQIAAKAGITFDPPHIVEANGLERLAAICVTGHLKDATEWSIGEASPHNYKTTGKQQPYPWAMAEKRAKDRVILKLIGIHGLVYSEEEADDFKQVNPEAFVAPDGSQPKPKDPIAPWKGPLTKTALKTALRALTHDLMGCADIDDLNGLIKDNQAIIDQCEADMPDWYSGEARDGFVPLQQRIANRIAELSRQPHEMLRAG